MLNKTYLTNSVVKKLSEGAELGWVNPKASLVGGSKRRA